MCVHTHVHVCKHTCVSTITFDLWCLFYKSVLSFDIILLPKPVTFVNVKPLQSIVVMSTGSKPMNIHDKGALCT